MSDKDSPQGSSGSSYPESWATTEKWNKLYRQPSLRREDALREMVRAANAKDPEAMAKATEAYNDTYEG